MDKRLHHICLNECCDIRFRAKYSQYQIDFENEVWVDYGCTKSQYIILEIMKKRKKSKIPLHISYNRTWNHTNRKQKHIMVIEVF